MKKFLVLFAFIFLLFRSYTLTRASECEDFDPSKSSDPVRLRQCQDELSTTLDQISKANTTNLNELRGLQSQVVKLQAQIKSLDGQLDKLTKEVFDREVKIGVREELLAARVKRDYIRKRDQPLLLVLFAADSAGQFFKDLAYREKLAMDDREDIALVSGEIKTLNNQSTNLKSQKTNLNALRVRVDEQASWLAGEVAKANKYVSDLSGKIAALSARQNEILAAKTEVFQTTVGDVPLADDYNASIDGFRNSAPSGSFAVFSFGAPHFKGMSQYGAYGRAKSGQSAEDILKAYYGGVEIKTDYDAGKQISVSGYGRMDIETYTKRIYEVPNSWGDDGFQALKAQAVAARTYALAWTREGTGGAICTTQSCQVYKNANKGGKWEEAVNETRGWVLVKDGKLIKPWYASTSGGYQESYDALSYRNDGSSYNTPAFWDTKNGRNGWTSEAYEKIAGSPWFYKAWYRSRSGDDCGRSNPWLSPEEMADVVNAWVVVYQRGESDSRVTPLGSCWGGNPYSTSQLRDKGGYTRVTGIEKVTYRSDGLTDNVSLQTDKGVITIRGVEFKQAFNLRAPGRVALKAGLFNIEKKE